MMKKKTIRNYVVYGAGATGAMFPFQYMSNKFRMVAYCDKAKEKQGKTLNGFPIIAKEELADFCTHYDIDIVFMSIADKKINQEVYTELCAMLGEELVCQNYVDIINDEFAIWKKIKERLLKKIVNNSFDVAFFESAFAYFVDSGSPLVLKYKEKKKEVLAVFPDLNHPEWGTTGGKNLERMYQNIVEYEQNGVCCTTHSNPELNKCIIRNYINIGYGMCYLPSNQEFGVKSRKIAIQTTPLLTHTYIKNPNTGIEKFDDVFSDYARNVFDYFVGSDYFCDWIVKKDIGWSEKVVRLGYPRMDALYESINLVKNVPADWGEKVNGRKVYLSTIRYSSIEQYLKLFNKDNPNRVLIYRPHPLELKNKGYMAKIKKYEEDYSVIIDLQPSYYAACSISDALISEIEISLNLNYLYYQKPVLLIMRETQVGDYEEQAWYKAMYKARTYEEVENFIGMVDKGEDYQKENIQLYREYMTKGFDGLVCERIYNYIEHL